MENLYAELENDVRFIEGLKACIHCGTCSAICPAAAVTDYDPRLVVNIVQMRDEEELIRLLKSDTIWQCAECLSCKTRCPRGNTPGYIIQALRALSVKSGMFAESRQGRKQLAIKRTVGEHILRYGYCVYIDEVHTGMYPEQGPVWDWIRDNKDEIMQRLGTSYKKEVPGTLRQIPRESLEDLNRIFEETGATKSFREIEERSAKKARELGFNLDQDDDDYFRYLYNE
jgi:heterodisulfide reductase subunit C